MGTTIDNIENVCQQYANILNKAYSSEVIKAQQVADKMYKQISYIYDNLGNYSKNLSNISSAIDVLNNAGNRITKFNTQIEQCYSTLKKIDINTFAPLLQSLSSAQTNKLEDVLISFNKAIEDKYFEKVYNKLYDTLQAIPDSFYDSFLENKDVDIDDFKEEIESIKEEKLEDYSIKGKTPDEAKQIVWRKLNENHPIVTQFLRMVILIFGMWRSLNDCVSITQNIIIPIRETAIVHYQGQENTYYVRTDSAKIYIEPDSHSKKISVVLYGEELHKIDELKMWIKIEYQDEDGQIITGWIAKRNLMTYRDYEFYQDKLYDQ